MKIIGWPYKITLKSVTGHTNLWLTDVLYYDNRKLIAVPQVVFFVWQFMVHSMICMSGQPGKYKFLEQREKCK